MIRRLDRYIATELLLPFIIGTFAVVLMFVANTLMRFSQDIFGKEINYAAVGQLILFSIPGTLKLTLPMATTLAAALGMSRLSRESEVTAMRAAGISVRRILLPILLFGGLVSLLSFFLAESVVPRSEVKFNDTLRRIFSSGEGIGVRSNVLLKFDNGRYYVNIANVAPGEKGAIAMSDIDVFYKPKIGEIWHYHADDGYYADGVMTLLQPKIRQLEGEQTISFKVKDKLQITQRISTETFFGQPPAKEQTAVELRATIEELRSRGLVDSAEQYETEYHNRFSIPLACIVFALFAPIIAFHYAKGGAFVGVLLSIIIVFLYYNVWILTSQVLASAGILSPLLGAWTPNLLFATAALIALWRSE